MSTSRNNGAAGLLPELNPGTFARQLIFKFFKKYILNPSYENKVDEQRLPKATKYYDFRMQKTSAVYSQVTTKRATQTLVRSLKYCQSEED